MAASNTMKFRIPEKAEHFRSFLTAQEVLVHGGRIVSRECT
jgi:hypothetical protein